MFVNCTCYSINGGSQEVTPPVPLTVNMFRLPTIRLRALVLFFIWFSVSLCYYGITYFVPNLYGDKYLNTILGRIRQVLLDRSVYDTMNKNEKFLILKWEKTKIVFQNETKRSFQSISKSTTIIMNICYNCFIRRASFFTVAFLQKLSKPSKSSFSMIC